MSATQATWVTAIVVLSAGVFILAALGVVLHDAAGRLGDSSARRTARATMVAVVAWAGVMSTIAASVSLDFVVFLPAALHPLGIGLWAVLRTDLSRVLGAVRLERFIAMQVYRNAGALFLVLHAQAGLLSGGFSRNAGWGDVITGVLAAPVAWAWYRQVRWAAVLVVCWCAIGIVDLIVAPISAGVYGAQDLVSFPLNIIPLFLGPPLGILLQVSALRILYLQRHLPAPTSTRGQQQATTLGHQGRAVNAGRNLTPFRRLKIDPLGGHRSSVVDAGTRPRSRSLSR